MTGISSVPCSIIFDKIGISSGSMFHHLDKIDWLAWVPCCQAAVRAEHVGYHKLVSVSSGFIDLGPILVSSDSFVDL